MSRMNLRNASIKHKLTVMAMFTSSVAVILSSASFLIYDLVSFKQLLSQDLMTQGQIISYNSAAAMAFKDESAADVTLAALKAKPDVVAAVLYTTDGRAFAHYYRADETPVLPLPQSLEDIKAKGYRFTGNNIEVSNDVTLSGERLGTLFLQSDMTRWNTRARQVGGILGIFVLISGAFAWFVSSKLQTLVSGPILHLEQTMRAVSQDKNYGVRAVKSSGDEIGRLMDGFNTMLAEIEYGDKALQRAKHLIARERAGAVNQELVALLADLKARPKPLERLVIKAGGRVFFLRVDEIDWIEAAANYVKLHVGKESHLLRETINGLAAKLDPDRFLRIHRSIIVNLERVKELQPWFHGDYIVILQDGTRLNLSRTYRDRFIDLLGEIF